MKIGNVDTNKSVLVVAEIGNNHEGNFETAKKLIEQAAEAGADAVKFQTIVPGRLVAANQKDEISKFQRFHLSYEQYEKLSRVSEREGVLFLSTPFDIESARFLNALVPAFKISSGDNNFWQLIDVVARTCKPIILSSGFADLAQIGKTRDFIQKVWSECGIRQELVILHCVSGYPVPPQEANIMAVKQLQEELGVTVGYSDHTLGIDAAVLSVALGARIIEKHFTLDRNYSGFRDHQLSADPQDMALLVKMVREAGKLLGNGEKHLQKCERKNIGRMRRSIVASRDLNQGSILQSRDLTWLRPGVGLAPGHEAKLIGRKLIRCLAAGECVLPEHVEEEF
ncbi:N-acetylneuraminate synthase (EC [Olavius sp. associated proteobacterium Delta 1]|nr:N-acetylneuraminate synthase (EC [Olavius sp. associated proteobacterium Delta 1]